MTTYQVDGFEFAGIAAGIKKRGGLDLGLIAARGGAKAAGVFTQNLVRAAPVTLCHQRVQAGEARAVLVNSGNANACTGEPGLQAARDTTQVVASALGVDPEQVLPCSTGVIGQLLPTQRVAEHAAALVQALSPEADAFSEAILTTDRFPKIVSVNFDTTLGPARLLGIAKGAGMIHPQLSDGLPQATMLSYLLTDAQVPSEALRRALITASKHTFEACSVDGDTSTNDTVLLLASGRRGEPRAGALEAALDEVCRELARLMARDGEGAEHSVDITVTGLASDAEARQVATVISTSLLVKTALFGRDPNWGRLLAAAGRAGVPFDPARAKIQIGEAWVCDQGMATGGDAEARATAVMQAEHYGITVSLGDGPGRFTYTTCDLGHGYIDVNAGYRS